MSDHDRGTDLGDYEAAYVFGVTVRVESDVPGVWADPDTFETTVYRRADPPGEDGWLYFRDNLWHGELNAPGSVRELAESALGVPVADVSFRELRTDETYLDALKAEVGDSLDLFNADSTREALSKYLGSSIRVVD